MVDQNSINSFRFLDLLVIRMECISFLGQVAESSVLLSKRGSDSDKIYPCTSVSLSVAPLIRP